MNNKIAGAYLITDNDTGKVYVGSTGDKITRLKMHDRQLRNNYHPNLELQKVFNDKHKLEVTFLEIDDREEAFDYEQSLLDDFINSGLLFNKSSNARHNNVKGILPNDETREKMRISQLGKKHSEETKLKMQVSHQNLIRVLIDGQEYNSIAEASRQLDMHPAKLYRRVYSKNFTNYSVI